MSSRRAERLKKNPLGMSPASRQTVREKAEAAALAEVAKEARVKRERSARLKKLRLEKEKE